MITFRKCSSSFSFIFCWNNSRVKFIIYDVNESVNRPSFFSYLWRGSSLNSDDIIFMGVIKLSCSIIYIKFEKTLFYEQNIK